MENKKYQHKNGTGSLFKNEFKKSENHPDMTGVIVTPDGTEYKIRGWTKTNSKGNFLSLSISTDTKEFKKPTPNTDWI